MTKQASPEALEDQVARLLSERLLDVPLARGQAGPALLLEALLAAAFAHPVFAGSPSPVDAWLEEAVRVASTLHDDDALAWVRLRHAVVAMRRTENEAALAALDDAPDTAPASLQAWRAITRVRVLVRLQRSDEAWRVLQALPVSSLEGAMLALRQLAMGEYHLEANAIDAARGALLQVLRGLPETWVEERIQATQSLAFVHISLADPPRALRYLEQARAMLRGAGAWREVTQMDVAAGALLVARGDQAAAQRLFAEAAQFCEKAPQPDMQILIELGMARSHAAARNSGEAVAACLRAAKSYCEQGNLLGFVSVLVFMAGIQSAASAYAEAYRTLATGLAIARHRRWPAAEAALHAQVEHLRTKVLGPARFDEMVASMLQEMKRR